MPVPSERQLRGLDHARSGPEALLSDLIARGLRSSDLDAAAALVIELERSAPKPNNQPGHLAGHDPRRTG